MIAPASWLSAAQAHPAPTLSDDVHLVTKVPHLPYKPEGWNDILVLAEAQNLGDSLGTPKWVREYSAKVRELDARGDIDALAARLTLPVDWPPDAPRVHVGPWHSGPIRAALNCLGDGTVDPDRCAVSNAVPWAWTTDRGTDLNPILRKPEVVKAAAAFLGSLFQAHQPREVIACGQKAVTVVEQLRQCHGWKVLTRTWRQGSIRSLLADHGRLDVPFEVEALLARLPATTLQAFKTRPELHRKFPQVWAALYVRHALSAAPST